MTNFRKVVSLFCITSTMAALLFSLSASANTEELKENPYKVKRTLPKEMVKHRKLFSKGEGGMSGTYQLDNHPIYTVHSPGEWGGNVTFIVASDQVIVYDTSISTQGSKAALAEIRKITDKPIKTIFYSHHHTDHYNGTAALVKEADVKSGKVTIYAWENFVEEKNNEFGAILPRQAIGAAYHAGALLAKEDQVYFSCCGIKSLGGSPGYIAPTHTLKGGEVLKIGGVEIQVIYTGGEAISEFGLYLPKTETLILADEFFYSLPNIHSIRGSRPRLPQNYLKALDTALELKPKYLLGSHIMPVIGRKKIEEVVTLNRDAIQFMWDQSIRYINKGYDGMDLQQKFNVLPEYLTGFPFNTYLYGSPRTTVPEFYNGWVSWFNGDAATLYPDSRQDHARKLVKTIGGREKVLAAAEKAFNEKDYKYAARLSGFLVTIDTKDMRARYLKASSLRGIGYKEVNQIMRSNYLTGALELEGKIKAEDILKFSLKTFLPAVLDDKTIFAQWQYKINAEKIKNSQVSVCLKVKETNIYWDIKIRNSVMISKNSTDKICKNAENITLDQLNQLNKGSKKSEALSLKHVNKGINSLYNALDLKMDPINMSLR